MLKRPEEIQDVSFFCSFLSPDWQSQSGHDEKKVGSIFFR